MEKIESLTGRELDYWVAMAENWARVGYLNTGELVGEKVLTDAAWDELSLLPEFHKNPNYCMGFIAKKKIAVTPHIHRGVRCFLAYIHTELGMSESKMSGQTPEEAICKVVVQRKYPNGVPVFKSMGVADVPVP